MPSLKNLRGARRRLGTIRGARVGKASLAPNQAKRDFDVGQRKLLELLKRLELLDDDISAVRTDSERARACRVSDAARSNEAREGELA